MTVGLSFFGNMGHPMASNLVRKGKRVVVRDVNAEAMRALAGLGVALSGEERGQIAAGHRHRFHDVADHRACRGRDWRRRPGSSRTRGRDRSWWT